MKSLNQLMNELSEIKKRSNTAIDCIEEATQKWDEQSSPRALYCQLKTSRIYDTWIQEQREIQGNRCFNKKCKCLFTKDNPFTIDHVKPLKPKKIPINPDELWGYTANTTNNFVLLCRTCNKVKGNRTDINIWAGWDKTDLK
jgi:5-methylcytosine-specific restriction endonuclease McrA